MLFVFIGCFLGLFVLGMFVYWIGNKVYLATKRDERKFKQEDEEK